jgi:2-deoxy-scyllo-inosamine dehydrogenase (SAM-dependent)
METGVRVALPLVVEVEVNSRCNRRCSYCPVSILPTPTVSRFMPDEVFDRLLNELAAFSFDGRLSYHFYNEPLLRRDLEHLVERAAVRLPWAYQVLYTNGDLLSDARYEALLRAGIHEFVVTRHDSDGFTERPAQVVLVPSQLVLTNRGGVMSAEPAPLDLSCYAPADMLIVTVNGDILGCYEDAQRQHVMGNLTRESLLDIWTNDRFVQLRDRLASGDRAGAGSICARCDNRAHERIGASWFAL